MKKILLASIALLCILSCSENIEPTMSNEKISLRSEQDLCITTWNTFLLDSPDLGDGTPAFGPQCEGENCRERAQAICDRLLFNGGDVFMLQEVWEDIAIETLNDCLSSSGYQVFFDKDSGLMTAVKDGIPVSDVFFEEFEEEAGWDSYKNKGFLSLIIEPEEGCFFNLINTHLNAGDEAFVRKDQAGQINTFIENGDQSIPVIIGGDFNIPLYSTEYGQTFFTYFSTDYIPFTNLGDVSVTKTTDKEFLDYFLFAHTNGENVKNLVGNFIDQECQWTIINQYTGESFTTTSRSEMEHLKSIGYIVSVDWCKSGFSDHKAVEMCFTYDCDGENFTDETEDEIDPNAECYCDCVDRITGERHELDLSSCEGDCSHYSFFDCEKKQR